MQLHAFRGVSALARVTPLVILFAVLTGCQYLENRGKDLSDILQVEAGFPAIGVHVEATPLVNTGLDGWAAYPPWGGTGGNYQSRLPDQGEFAAYSLLFFHARGFDTRPAERDPEAGDEPPIPDVGTITHVHELGKAFDDRPCPDNLRPIHWLDVSADAALGLGLRCRFSPGELFDFLLGIFGADLGGDDESASEESEDATEEAAGGDEVAGAER